MGKVVKLQNQRTSVLSQIVIDALEAEQQHGRPIVLTVEDEQQQRQVRRMLTCMTGSKGTRIDVKTYRDLSGKPRNISDTGGTADSSS
jgi:hypothetical protein